MSAYRTPAEQEAAVAARVELAQRHTALHFIGLITLSLGLSLACEVALDIKLGGPGLILGLLSVLALIGALARLFVHFVSKVP